MWVCGMTFSGLEASSVLTSQVWTVALLTYLWLFSSAFTSACILLKLGVTFAPGLLFDADVEMLESVMR